MAGAPRTRPVAYQEVDASGVPAAVVGFASFRGAARLDVVLARDRIRVVRYYCS